MCYNILGSQNRSRRGYAHCHSGMRSYLAARILMQNGFEVYNLSGGYRLYNAANSGGGVKPLKAAWPKKGASLNGERELSSKRSSRQ